MFRKSRLISFILALSVLVSCFPVIPAYSEEEAVPASVSLVVPFRSDVSFMAGNFATTSNSFRIPSIVTLADGTLVAASDIRWNTTYDGGGIDTLVARSVDGGSSWAYTAANYFGDNGNTYNGSQSTAFVDPSLIVGSDGKTVYMLVDLFPYGVALNGSGHTQPIQSVAFDSNGRLLLTGNGGSFYLDGGKIYQSDGKEVKNYTVDDYFNITDGSTTTNLFFADSPYKVIRTSYLYLTSSTDGGATWSAPTLLNVKKSDELACLVNPGTGLSTSSGKLIYPVYSYIGDNEPSGNTQRLSFIYSDDGINWTRSSDFEYNWASEASVIELQNGNLRFFFRNGLKKLCYVDYNWSNGWGNAQITDIAINSNTEISAITYSRTSYGKQVVLVSCPTGPSRAGNNQSGPNYRVNGSIFVLTVEDDGTMTLVNTIEVNDNNSQFFYSCLAEREDGSVVILYEDKENGWGYGPNCYYTMDFKAYSENDLGVAFDSDTLTDESSNVSVSGIFPPDVEFNVIEITDRSLIESILVSAGADDELNIETDDEGNVIAKSFDFDSPYRFLDVNLTQNGLDFESNTPVTVSLDAESIGLQEGDQFMVYHLHDNGDGTFANEWIGPYEEDNGTVSFPMDKFSYILVFNSSYQVSGKAVYFVQDYYDNKNFPLSNNGTWGLIGVYVDSNEVPHVLVAKIKNGNTDVSKVESVFVNGVTYYSSDISIYSTGSISQFIVKNDNNEIRETITLSETNISGTNAVWDIICYGMTMSEMSTLALNSKSGGFDIPETVIDLKLNYNISKDIVSVDGDINLSGNSVVLPTTLTDSGISCDYFEKEVIYRIVVNNTGDINLDGVQIYDILPNGFYSGNVYISNDQTVWTQANITDGQFNVASLNLAAHTSATYYVKLTMKDSVSAETYINTAAMNVDNVVTSATAEIVVPNPNQGVLTVSKEVNPNLKEITDTFFSFSLKSGSSVIRTFQLRHGESTSFILEAGSYTLEETVHASGKFTADQTSRTAVITAGETTEIKFINTYSGADFFRINYIPVGKGTVSPEYESVSIHTGDSITYGPVYGSTAETLSGASFQGWFSDESCTDLISNDLYFVPTMPSGGWVQNSVYNFYAKFSENTATINYVVVGPDGCGSVDPSSESVNLISGLPQGSTASPLSNAYKFVGWFSDSSCTQAVPETWLDGNGKFIPQKSGDLWTNATYYAKFEYNLTSLTIKKIGANDVDPNQVFLFHITGNDIDLDVSVKGDTWTATIDGLSVGQTYTVTEKSNWSWRYSYKGVSDNETTVNITSSVSNGAVFTLNPSENVISFTNVRSNTFWLDGDSWCTNIFK